MSADGHHTSKEIVVDGISTLDEPSVEWGWHQHSRKVGLVTGGFFVLFLLAMLFGNHIGRVEDIWLVAVAVFLAIWMFLSLRPKKDDTLKRNRVFEVSSDHYAVVGAAASGHVGAEAARNPQGRAPARH
ncbi:MULTISPECIES: DUF2631 domain-containing protein [Dietzia]|jgi:uncharacterized membrane protein|uniref:DUF2631 domain-containing protein n=4 Tax=Dietzia TaxID=37914 RepID=A0A365P9Y4_9ACTN|nr:MULTISPECIES: DUF2631 domain-containing protein [Dietzia]MBB0991622.1 DUF2631 domain-containing protein [Dietzia sp. SLG510A3-30A2]MBB0993507.1 DUF2631 domain-containing protein [Dietzia sp. SLG510A3-40A3]MBB1009300.1 DUF2631 domain-containing protein [Dietzia sp. SLG510A3-3B2-2]MVZ89317.1 DUF2631 domain-containing protein [Microbacter sp. ANSKLAB05]MBB0997478.1 DUF2631 domain-containing protein [Dietzia maris]